MNNNSNQPREFDAVLGGEAPPPVSGVVLGGIEGVKSRLQSSVVAARVAALSEALHYEDEGLDLVIQALENESKLIHRRAYRLLRNRVEAHVQEALQEYKLWNLKERLCINGYPGYTEIFANRRVEEFNPITGITDPVGIAYVIRNSDSWNSQDNFAEKLEILLQDPQASNLEALVIGIWNGDIVEQLVAVKDRLKSLKTIFIGDIISYECEISWIRQSDISPILASYPHLEILQVRGGDGLEFSPIKHDRLEALIIETGGLDTSTIADICQMDLPELEHLELWLGEHNYGGNSSIKDLNPILFDNIFPNLIYLGLRNSEYADDIADAIVRSPLIKTIKILDLSMGTLTNEGADKLLNCPAVEKLEILNMSANYLSDGLIASVHIDELLQEERGESNAVHLMVDKQKYPDGKYRYCSVAE